MVSSAAPESARTTACTTKAHKVSRDVPSIRPTRTPRGSAGKATARAEPRRPQSVSGGARPIMSRASLTRAGLATSRDSTAGELRRSAHQSANALLAHAASEMSTSPAERRKFTSCPGSRRPGSKSREARAPGTRSRDNCRSSAASCTWPSGRALAILTASFSTVVKATAASVDRRAAAGAERAIVGRRLGGSGRPPPPPGGGGGREGKTWRKRVQERRMPARDAPGESGRSGGAAGGGRRGGGRRGGGRAYGAAACRAGRAGGRRGGGDGAGGSTSGQGASARRGPAGTASSSSSTWTWTGQDSHPGRAGGPRRGR